MVVLGTVVDEVVVRHGSGHGSVEQGAQVPHIPGQLAVNNGPRVASRQLTAVAPSHTTGSS